MGKSQDLYIKAKTLIPGGTQLLSKRPEMYLPNLWPAYYEKAQGCTIWDLDGKKYTDMSSMGIGSCILGYADPDVNEAVKLAVDHGSMSTLNCPEEVELTELLCELHPWADMARFTRSGGEAVAVAVRIARAKTKKDIVLFCGYHGWHDWYLSANLTDEVALNEHLLEGLNPSGVPQGLRATAVPFNYNDTQRFLSLVKEHEGRIAAVVMEPVRSTYPVDGFLETVREVTTKENIVLVFDEITVGWRMKCGGAHLQFDIDPDMAVFAKGLANGYPMAAIIGTRQVMEVAQDTFMSSTNWTEKIGPVAALATINKMNDLSVADHLTRVGNLVQSGWNNLAEKHGLNIKISGIPPLGGFTFLYQGKELLLKTLFTQLMLEEGILATTAFYASYAHDETLVDQYLEKVDRAFALLAKSLQEETLETYLKEPVCHAGFERLT